MNEALQPSLMVTVAFYATSALTIASAILVVIQKDLVRSVVALAVSFVGVAAIFFLLNAEFIGIVQILVYVGAVSIIIAFAVMFIRDLKSAGALSQNMLISAAVSVVMLAVIIFVTYNTDWTGIEEIGDPNARAGLMGQYITADEDDGVTEGAVLEFPVSDMSVTYYAGIDISEDALKRTVQSLNANEVSSGVLIDSSSPIGELLIRNFILPFETIGLLLIAALIGALVIIKDRRGETKE